MLYTLRIVLTRQTPVPKHQPLYHILGWVMNLFDNQQAYYDAILKLSIRPDPHDHHRQTVFLTVRWSDNYNMIVSYLLTHHPKSMSLNGTIYTCDCLQFHNPPRDPQTRTPPSYTHIHLTLLSPTAISHGDWYYYLPNPEKFLLSWLRRAKEKNFTDQAMTDEFVSRVKHTVIVSQLRIQTVPTIIKNAPKAWVIGKVSYTLTDTSNKEFVTLLAIATQWSHMVGIGKGKTLGMGDCRITMK
jgi:hypothetical protein